MVDFFAKRLLKYSNETHFSYCYLGKYNGEEIKIQKEEVEGTRLVKKEELDGLYEFKDSVIREEIEWIKKVWEIKVNNIL